MDGLSFGIGATILFLRNSPEFVAAFTFRVAANSQLLLGDFLLVGGSVFMVFKFDRTGVATCATPLRDLFFSPGTPRWPSCGYGSRYSAGETQARLPWHQREAISRTLIHAPIAANVDSILFAFIRF
jgi:hypothetical protein